MKDSGDIRPLALGWTLLAGLIPAIMFYITHFAIVPRFLDLTGYPYLIGYLIGWGGTMFLIFLASVVAYRLERNPMNWKAFSSRYRLGRMSGKDWIWAVGVFVFTLVTYFGLTFTAEWLASLPGFSPPDFYPPELRPGGASKLVPGMFMGMSLKQKWWIPAVYFVGWFFNIFGEEFWFRGFMLPRQELDQEKLAWAVNGILFTILHLWQKWNMLLILPGALVGAYAVQKRQNTCILIVAHGVANLGALLPIIAGVVG